MFLRIQTSVSTMLEQQHLATIRALNVAFGDSQAAAPAPEPVVKSAPAGRTSAITSVTLRQQVAASADTAANAAIANIVGQARTLSDRPLENAPLPGVAPHRASAALAAAHAAYAEVIDGPNQ